MNPGSKPLQLIYPFELRTKEWYDTYKRDSYNIKIGFTRVLNKKNIIGLYPELTRQWGLLATPFHRIYFSDNSIAVENLPYERMKAAVALKVNSFVGGKTILKNALNLYSDNFGIVAVAVENENGLKNKTIPYTIAQRAVLHAKQFTIFCTLQTAFFRCTFLHFRLRLGKKQNLQCRCGNKV